MELPEPDYRTDTDDDLDPPRARRRLVLVVIAVVAVVAAGVSLGLLIATSSSADSGAAAGSDELPTLELPAGCDLLTPGQVAVLVPGVPTKLGRGPELVVDSTESACDWANADIDPTDPRVQPAILEVRATAAVDEESARDTMRISRPCQGAHDRAVVAGADEACLDHKKPAKGQPDGDVSTVSARFKTLVVEVSYQRHNWPAWRVDDQSEVTAAALFGRIAQGE
jgi:hypothetical protein